jgi:hydrogenase nickel incorporation protein HypA/HybF
MHELSLTQNVLNAALENASQAKAERVRRVNLVLGEFSDESEDSIQFYWDELAAGTPAQGAELHFERVPAELECVDCGSKFTSAEVSSECPFCLSPRIRITSDDDIRLESIDVE